MKKLLLLLLSGAALRGLPATAQTINPVFELRPGEPVVCPSRPETMNTRVAPPAAFLSGKAAAGATITVTYTGFTPQAQAAFQYAVDIWKTQLSSGVPIRVAANWSALASGVLGSAGPTTYATNFSGALQANVLYPIALAEKLAGQDLNGPANPDISANFSSSADWYYGTDGKTPAGQYDLVSVVLHELCHGLGFIAGANYNTTNQQGSYGFGTPVQPLTFATFMENTAGQRLTDPALFANPSVALGTQYTSNGVYFNGPLAVAANPTPVEKRPRLYAPATYRPGSSISHLNEATYPAGDPNSLMTFAIGAGEAIQNPGPLVVGMFNDMGWFATAIRHAPLPDTETAQDYPVLATIVSDGTVTPGSVRLNYSVNGGALQTRVMTATGQAGQFQSSIPNPGLNATVRYYLSASDNETGRTYTAPGQPAPGAARAVYQFFVGPDTTPPVAQHTPPTYLFANQLPVQLVVRATDNVGVASVSVPYSVNGVARTPLVLTAQADGVTYLGQLSTAGGPIVAGDALSYRVVATDRAAAANTTTLGPFAVPIVGLKAPQAQYVNNFNAASSDFVGTGFSITQPAGFANPAIHSTHPYADATTITYQLLVPIVVKSDPALATVKFDEIVLVEPGEPGSLFDTPDFYDYVVVEGSLDGVKWTPLADGYDSRDNAQWLSTWNSGLTAAGNSTAVGTPALYAPRTLNLRDRFAAGAVVQLRFRLFADPGAFGWGWSVDNLAVQNTVLATRAETLTAGGLRVYPSPSADGLTRVQARLARPTAGLEVQVRNTLGQLLLRQPLAGTLTQLDQPLDLHSLAAGLYFVSLSSGAETTTCKVVKQ